MSFNPDSFSFDLENDLTLTARTKRAYNRASVNTFFQHFSTFFGASNLSLLNPLANLPAWSTTLIASIGSGIMATLAKQRTQRRKNLNLVYSEIVNNRTEFVNLVNDEDQSTIKMDQTTIQLLKSFWKKIDKIDNPSYRADLQRLTLDFYKINLLKLAISKLKEQKTNSNKANDPDELALLETIKQYIQSIGDPARSELSKVVEDWPSQREKALQKLESFLYTYNFILSNTISIVQEQEEKNNQINAADITSFNNNLETYKALQNNELTYDEVASITHKANRSFLYWVGMGLAGLIYFKLLFTPVGAVLGALTISYALYKGYQTYKETAARKIAKIQNEEKLAILITHHNLEFGRLIEKLQSSLTNERVLTNADLRDIETAWVKINTTINISKATLEQLQKDFLTSLNQVVKNPSLYATFKENWLVNLDTNLQKIVAINATTSASSEKPNRALTFLTNTASTITDWVSPLYNNSFSKFLKRNITNFVAGVSKAVNYVNLVEEINYSDLTKRFAANAERFELLKSNDDAQWALLWGKINNIDNPVVRCQLQEKLLQYAKQNKPHKLVPFLQKIDYYKNTTASSVDFDSKTNDYLALQTGQLTSAEKKRLSANTLRSAFSSGSLLRGIMYMIAGASKIITESISSILAFSVGLFAGYERYSQSGADKIIRKRRETAPEKIAFFQQEFENLKTLLKDSLPKYCENKWEAIINSGLEKTTIAELLKDFLINLRNFKFNGNEEHFEKSIASIDSTLEKINLQQKLIKFVKANPTGKEKKKEDQPDINSQEQSKKDGRSTSKGATQKNPTNVASQTTSTLSQSDVSFHNAHATHFFHPAADLLPEQNQAPTQQHLTPVQANSRTNHPHII